MNSLYSETLNWIGDGSDGCTLTQKDGTNEVMIASKSSGTPYNVRLDSEKVSSDYYFQVTLQELKGNFSIGVVSKNEFRPGWKVKGMFYNGNLTNGSGALKVDWGPRFQVGDSLGCRVSSGEVTFYKNGNCLGTGFRLAAANNKTFYPCLHITGSVTLGVEIPQELPSTEVTPVSPSGFLGDWKVDKVSEGETPLTIPEGRPLKLVLSKKGPNIQLMFKIANSLNGSAKVVEESESEMTVESGPFMMTMMMPPPDYRPLENLIGSKKISKLSLEGGNLILSGAEIKIECSQMVRNPKPLTKY